MTDYVLVTLLVVHILAVVAWTGAALLFSSVLGPSLSNMTPTGRAEFLTKMVPRYTSYVLVTSIIAVIFGVGLYAYTYNSTNFPSGTGATLVQAGAGVGLVALIVSLALVMPAARNLVRMVKESGGSTPPASGQAGALNATQKRVRMGTAAVAGLLFVVLVLMVVGATI